MSIAQFTIPSGILGLSSPRTIFLDNNVAFASVAPKRTMRFGDGYSLAIPVGSTIRTINGSFSNRLTEEVDLIEGYFKLLGTSSVFGQRDILNAFYVFGEQINATLEGYSKVFHNDGIYSISAEFREVFRGVL